MRTFSLPARALLAFILTLAAAAVISTPTWAAKRDTSPPSAPVLSALAGNQQVVLSWQASTDNVGVARYEVWMDNGYVVGLPAATLSYTVTGLANGVTHNFRVVAYDAAGNYANSNTVSIAALAGTITTTSASTSGTPAPYPSRLTVSGRHLVDENNYVMPTLRGFNVQVVPWSQADFDAMASLGAKIVRTTLFWDTLEPTQGNISSTVITALDTHIARLQAAGMYTLLELHFNVGRDPSWTSAYPTEMEKYAAYGQTLTQYLAYRYGNPASPRYTKAVIGFGLNEPPLEDNTIRNGNSAIPYLESKQRQMISWMRAPGFAPSWIGFVAYGYASATPIYDPTWQNASATNADPHAYDSVGGNVIVDVHDYGVGCTNTDVGCDGRQWNGMVYPTYQGGPLIGTGDSTFTSYTSSALYRSQQAAYLNTYKTFSQQANIPLMLGEWGWPQGPTGETAWITDKMAAWANVGMPIQIQWNYDVSSSNTVWAARPGGTWRPSVTSWLTAPL